MDFITFMLDPSSHEFKIFMALFLGAFVGLRRQIQMQQAGKKGFVGFRTMPLIVLLGALVTFFPEVSYLPTITFLGVLAFLVVAYAYGAFKLNLIGLTSEISTLLMFIAGLLVGYGEPLLATVLAVFVATFNAFKSQLHNFANTISPKEWAGSLQLIIVSAIILPLLPKEAIDPWGVLVPFEMWLVVIFISTLGFIGYFLNKYFGHDKSVLATAFLGSFVSSTAVTTYFSLEARKQNSGGMLYLVLGVFIAVITMLIRVIVEVAVLSNVESRPVFIVTPIIMCIAAFIYALAWWAWKKEKIKIHGTTSLTALQLKSPFNIMPALKFATMFSVVLLAIAVGKEYFGSAGVLTTAFFSALVDVDAATISAITSFKAGELGLQIAFYVVVFASVVNTLVKAVYAFVLGGKEFGKHIALFTTFVSACGLATMLFI